MFAGRRYCRGSGRDLRPSIQDRQHCRDEDASLRLELPVRGSLYSRRRSWQHIGLSRRRIGQETPQCDQLLPVVAGGGRSSRQSLRYASGCHTGLSG